MENTFIRLSTELLKRTDLSAAQKIILSYFLSYQANKQACYQTEAEIAEALGMTLITIKRNIKSLIQMKYCYKEKASKYSGKRQYKNRKAILVGEQPKEDIKAVLKVDNVSNDTITPIKPLENKIEAPKTTEVDIEHKINDDKVFNIESQYIKVYKDMITKNGLLRKLNSSRTQNDFNLQLENRAEYLEDMGINI